MSKTALLAWLKIAAGVVLGYTGFDGFGAAFELSLTDTFTWGLILVGMGGLDLGVRNVTSKALASWWGAK